MSDDGRAARGREAAVHEVCDDELVRTVRRFRALFEDAWASQQSGRFLQCFYLGAAGRALSDVSSGRGIVSAERIGDEKFPARMRGSHAAPPQDGIKHCAGDTDATGGFARRLTGRVLEYRPVPDVPGSP